jgi:hypothetical protein
MRAETGMGLENRIEMQHAILLATRFDGWAWELIDANGESVASGRAADKDGAMLSAQQTSLALASAAPSDPVRRAG